MEIDITNFARNEDPGIYSASAAELGQNAGKITWDASMEAERLLTTPEMFEALRAHAKGFGAWSEEEIAGWTEQECNALFVQLVSGDLREATALAPGDNDEGIDWEEARELCEAGTLAGNLWEDDDDKIYYYLGS